MVRPVLENETLPMRAGADETIGLRLDIHDACLHGEPRDQFRKYLVYSVSRWAGRKPASRMMWRSSSSVVQFVVPAARTTFSSSMTEPTSLPPKRRPIWQTFKPCVTQLDCTFSMFERKMRAMASVFRYSTEVASSQPRPPSAVLPGWNVQGMNAVNPLVSCCRS